MKVSGLYCSLLVIIFSLIFQKKIGGGGTEKSLARLLFNQTEWYQSVNKKLAEHPQ